MWRSENKLQKSVLSLCRIGIRYRDWTQVCLAADPSCWSSMSCILILLFVLKCHLSVSVYLSLCVCVYVCEWEERQTGSFYCCVDQAGLRMTEIHLPLVFSVGFKDVYHPWAFERFYNVQCWKLFSRLSEDGNPSEIFVLFLFLFFFFFPFSFFSCSLWGSISCSLSWP